MRHPTVRSIAACAAIVAVVSGASLAYKAGRKPAVLPDVPMGKDQATFLPNGWRVTPAGRPIPLPGDLPLKMIFTPDGKYLVVNTAGYHDHTISLIDVGEEKIARSVNVGKDWAGMCLNAEGDDVYASGGGAPDADFLEEAAALGASPAMLETFKHPILRLSLKDGVLTPMPSMDIPGLPEKDRWVAGIASDASGALYAANISNDTVYKLAGSPRKVVASAPVGYRPYGVALSPDGSTLAVSNWGASSVSLLDSETLQEKNRIPVGTHPNELVWGKDGRLFVANAGSDSVSVIAKGSVVETIKTALDPKGPIGSTPDALALSSDGARLYVANAGNNDVAVIDSSDAKESRVIGFLPTGWYPSALAVAPDGKKLYVGTGKGLKFRANSTPMTAYTDTNYDNGHKYDYIGGVLSGTVSVVDLPDAAGLARYTRQVHENVPGGTRAIAEGSRAVRDGMSALKKIKHVVYIIRENRTYDQVFGDISQGNGDPALVLFGRKVTPNAHALANRFVLLDNLYCNGEVSEDGHQWCDAAYATDFTEKAWPNSYSGRREPAADSRLTGSPAGYLWDNAARHGVTFFNYGEGEDFSSTPNMPPVFAASKELSRHSSAAYQKVSYDAHSDQTHADIFLADLAEAEKTGVWPQLMVMSLGEDHTQGTSPGKYTPIAHVACNDQAVGRLIEGISRSRFWKETAIFLIEDDAQNGPDHVDAHRTVGLIVSPYVRRGVDSNFYTTASYVRTIELILGLPPMTQFDAAATPLLASFTSKPDFSVVPNLVPQVDLEARNTKTTPGAAASARLDFSAPDRADFATLNKILWKAIKPGIPMPAPVRGPRLAMLPPRSKEEH